MSSIVLELYEKRKISCEPFVSQTHYETIIGSEAYGVSNNNSDVDIYGFTIPPKEYLFYPQDCVIGFEEQRNNFEQFQQHHVKHGDREYDLNIYNISKYFRLCAENNPNMIDSLYTPERCIKHISKIGELIRSERKIFLHKGSFHKFRGYAHAQLHKASEKNYNRIAEILKKHDILKPPSYEEITSENLYGVPLEDIVELRKLYEDASKNPSLKRLESTMKFGWDVKFGYHVVRLSDEAEQILTHGSIDLERNKEMMKAVRAGEMTLEDVKKWFQEKELQLEKLYHESTAVPFSPDVKKIKALLLNCIEEFYGSLKIHFLKPISQGGNQNPLSCSTSLN